MDSADGVSVDGGPAIGSLPERTDSFVDDRTGAATRSGRPAARYGRRRPRLRRRSALAAAVAGVLLLVGFAGWAAWRQSRQVSWQLVTYQVDGDSTAQLTFQVTRPAGTAVICTVQALNRRHAVVGLQDVPVPTGSGQTVQLSAEVRTAERAVAVAVKTCAAGGG